MTHNKTLIITLLRYMWEEAKVFHVVPVSCEAVCFTEFISTLCQWWLWVLCFYYFLSLEMVVLLLCCQSYETKAHLIFGPSVLLEVQMLVLLQPHWGNLEFLKFEGLTAYEWQVPFHYLCIPFPQLEARQPARNGLPGPCLLYFQICCRGEFHPSSRAWGSLCAWTPAHFKGLLSFISSRVPSKVPLQLSRRQEKWLTMGGRIVVVFPLNYFAPEWVYDAFTWDLFKSVWCVRWGEWEAKVLDWDKNDRSLLAL